MDERRARWRADNTRGRRNWGREDAGHKGRYASEGGRSTEMSEKRERRGRKGQLEQLEERGGRKKGEAQGACEDRETRIARWHWEAVATSRSTVLLTHRKWREKQRQKGSEEVNKHIKRQAERAVGVVREVIRITAVEEKREIPENAGVIGEERINNQEHTRRG
ncbi:hypothetical protein NDU88_007384 [Pleurodeles waltl]|uniref:Uncharacterized protein n=1 Tax=Pleurodeles waltl TaxID=8319 RepID=A0AAV7PTF7_PLEWA|nr:hypothetical protein NDU88_007384 [Pleurodeles waltl]